jgi:hypothetical protein
MVDRVGSGSGVAVGSAGVAVGVSIGVFVAVSAGVEEVGGCVEVGESVGSVVSVAESPEHPVIEGRMSTELVKSSRLEMSIWSIRFTGVLDNGYDGNVI